MRHLFDPHLVHPAFGDPGLYVDFRDERRALLFDMGDLATLPPRKLMRVSQIFVTHAHMDHFAGFDHWLRVVLGRKSEVVVFGGPHFIAQVEHKLRAYTWNVVHRYEIELVIDVRETGVDDRGRRCRFSSRSGFAREDCPGFESADDVLDDEPTFRARARFVDHDVPCLAYAVEENAHVNVAKDRLAAMGVSTGAWLRELKHAVLTGAPDSTPIHVRWRDRDGDHAMNRPAGELRHLVLDIVPSGERASRGDARRLARRNRRARRLKHCRAPMLDQSVGRRYSLNCSRSVRFESLPVAVCGSSSTNTTSSGSHHLAILPS
jgi:ribonuclease Z